MSRVKVDGLKGNKVGAAGEEERLQEKREESQFLLRGECERMKDGEKVEGGMCGSLGFCPLSGQSSLTWWR